MRLADKSGWSDVVYRLFYPSILGSMLYDLVPLWREPCFKWFLVTKTSIVIIYVLAYIHSYRDLDVAGEAQKGWLIVVDAALAVLFGLSYVCVTWGSLRMSGVSILIASAFLAAYPGTKALRGPVYLAGKFAFLSASALLAVVAYSLPRECGWPACAAVLAVAGTYALHVFVFTELAKRASARKADAPVEVALPVSGLPAEAEE